MKFKLPNTAEPSRLLRSRYQICAGLIVAVLFPALVRTFMVGVTINQATQYNTIIGSAIALIFGFIAFRRLHVFPGISSGGYIITSFTISFATLATILFFFRMEYSRLQLLSNFTLTLAYFIYIHVRFTARKSINLGFISGDEGILPPPLTRVKWHLIVRPDDPTPPVEGVVADLRADYGDLWSGRIAAFAMEGIPVYHIKQAVEQLTGQVEIEHISENTLGSVNPNDVYLKGKAVADAIVAAIVVIGLSPLLVVVALAIRLDSKGPILFRQDRTGFRARSFKVYKFRTMRSTIMDPGFDPRQLAMTQDGDPRITRVGRFLRKSRIDELPQLLNVIRGEMSLIGPRPEAVQLTAWYEQEIPFYHYRHILKPGITGWAQINQGHVANVDDVRTKLNLDFYYVKNFSFWLDLLIAVKTVHIMVTGHGAK